MAGILVAVVAFVLVTHVASSQDSSSNSAGMPRERGLPVGAQVPSRLLESTNGTPIQQAGGRVVAVSTDTLDSSGSLASQLHLGYPILQDRDHALGSAFDVFRLPMGGMDMGPVDSHSIFVVDANGHVAWKKLAADTMHVSVDEVVGAVKAA